VPPGDPRSTVNWAALAAGTGTIVLLMAVANLPAIADYLVDGGRAADTPAAVVENASLPDQRVVLGTLATIAERSQGAAIVPPAIVVVGAVVSDLTTGEVGVPL
jgi:uroporphyrin-III C-methyltransferase/precorrin-2 dehydrogenase/sirohydrochlorin ferrochelatase